MLAECGDFEADFPQLIYNLHFAHPELAIGETYRLAQDLVASLVSKGVLEVVRIAYREEAPNHLSPSTVTTVPLDELRRVWNHPLVWDREKLYDAPSLLFEAASQRERLALQPTALGEQVLDQMIAGREDGPNR